MSLLKLKKFLTTRDKYINLFMILSRYDVPMDVKNYIIGFIPLNIEIDDDFTKDIKLISKTVSKDACFLLNYILVVFINEIVHKAYTVTEHRRAKRLKALDVEYALGIYPYKNSTLIKQMMENGANINDRLLDYKYNKSTSKKKAIHLKIDYNTVNKHINKYFRPIKTTTIKKKYNYLEDVQIEANVSIYLAAVLEILIEKMLFNNNNADDILKTCNQDIEIKSLFVALFPLQ